MAFEPRTWRNYPNTSTPISAEEMNRIESGIEDVTYMMRPPTGLSAASMRDRSYTGSYRVLSAEAQALGLPDSDNNGVFQVVHVSGNPDTGHVIQYWTTRFGELWTRYILSGTDREWTEWVKSTGEIESDLERVKESAADQKAVVKQIDSKTESVQSGHPDSFRVMDRYGSKSFEVSPSGKTILGDPVVQGSPREFRIMDKTGAVALEVSEEGRTYIYDTDASGGGDSGPRIREWHIFLAAGQSNMSGRGQPYSDLLDPPDERIREYGFNNRTLRTAGVPLDMMDSPRGMSPATGFAREYLKNVPSHIGVVLVPAARGGTTFTNDTTKYTWIPGAATDPANGLFELSVQATLEAMNAVGERGQLRGILWHQGEGNGGMSADSYASHLDNLIETYRTEFQNPNLPVVIGQLSQEGNHLGNRTGVDVAHKNTPARIEYTGFAPSKWGWASYDTTHFGRTGTVELGKNYYYGYLQALGNYEGSQILPPHEVEVKRVGSDVIISWTAPHTRVTGYQLRHRPYGTEEPWVLVTREDEMALSEVLNVSGSVEIQITSYNSSMESTSVYISA